MYPYGASPLVKRPWGRVDDFFMTPRRAVGTLLSSILMLASVPLPAVAGGEVPDWVKPAVSYLDDNGYYDRADFNAEKPMTRDAFKRLMRRAFGGGYRRTGGYVTTKEVSRSLVKKLGYGGTARHLREERSPDGWSPEPRKSFGSEVLARELGLRHDRPTSEEARESSADEVMPQADILYAVWKAKTAPSTWAGDALGSFSLGNFDRKRRKVVKFAVSLVGTPYVYGGEWADKTPASYPYGAQAHGGLDCSGFAWYVLRRSSAGWDPTGRDYEGWSLPERSSSEMARATRDRLGFSELKAADLIFFASGGRDAKVSSVYHAGIYLGRGWMIHSSGSRAGISLAEVGPGSYWHDQIVFGRRVIR